MKFYKIILIAITLVFACLMAYFFVAHSGIKDINSYQEAAAVLDQADEQTLVLFDVDDTLIVPQTATFWPGTLKNHAHEIDMLSKTAWAQATKPVTEAYKNYILSIWMTHEQYMLIDPTLATTIQKLQQRGVRVFGLTALMTGSYGIIPSFPAWRIEKLAALGIDFNNLDIPMMEFNNFPAKNGTYPIFKHGILFSNEESKGAVLGAFLDRLDWRPDRIIFFDDQLKQVQSVAAEAHRRSIPFIGFHVTVALHLPDAFDPKLAAFQADYLVKHETWLSNDEARALMDKPRADQHIVSEAHS